MDAAHVLLASKESDNKMSTDEEQGPYQKESYIRIQFWIASCVLLGNILVGYTVAWPAPVMGKLKDLAYSPLPYVLTENEASWLSSVNILSTALGANGFGYLSNIIGRKRCFIFGGIVILIGCAMMTAALDIVSMFIGRILTGAGCSSILVNNMVYLGEISSTNIRGFLLASIGLMHTVGCLLVYSVGPFVSYYIATGLQVVLASIYIAGCFTIPESPMFYMIKGKKDEAKAVLQKLGRSKDFKSFIKINDTLLDHESNTDEKDGTLKMNPKEPEYIHNNEPACKKCLILFTDRTNRKALIIVLFLFLVEHSSGNIIVAIYATSIFHNAGSSIQPDIATIILGSTEVLVNLMMSLSVEKVGRRVLLLISTSGCSVCLALMGTHFYLDFIRHPFVPYLGWLPLVSLTLYIIFYNLGLSGIPSTLAGELFSSNIRGIGSSISFSTGVFFAFLSGVTFGDMVECFGNHVMFWILATINFTGFIFSIFIVPETKGKSLPEIQAMLAK